MTREEQIKQKAHEISQMCFPDSQNIWARPNIEAQCVQSACCEMVRWADENPKEGLVNIDKVCEWLNKNLTTEYLYVHENDDYPITYVRVVGTNETAYDVIEQFRKAMEE